MINNFGGAGVESESKNTSLAEAWVAEYLKSNNLQFKYPINVPEENIERGKISFWAFDKEAVIPPENSYFTVFLDHNNDKVARVTVKKRKDNSIDEYHDEIYNIWK